MTVSDTHSYTLFYLVDIFCAVNSVRPAEMDIDGELQVDEVCLMEDNKFVVCKVHQYMGYDASPTRPLTESVHPLAQHNWLMVVLNYCLLPARGA